MRANLKRYISLLLCGVMLFSIMPLQVFANAQKHVKLTKFEVQKGSKDPSYKIDIGWEDSMAVASSNDPDDHATEGYKIQGRNATTNEQFSTKQTLSGVSKQEVTITEKLSKGALYEYKVVPYHMHKGANGSSSEAPYDKSTKEETAIFMSDIEVESKGYGNTLEVTFDNPSYAGKSVFTGYRIYYQKGGGNFNDKTPYVDVGINNKDLVSFKDEARQVYRLTYKINNETIKPADVYSVKIEPMIDGQEVRKANIKQIVINGEAKKFAYSLPTDSEYRSLDAYVEIPLYVNEDGNDYLKLVWGDISGIPAVGKQIERIDILSGTEDNDINHIIASIYSDFTSITSWQIEKPKVKTYYKIKVTIKSNVGNKKEYAYSMIASYDPNNVIVTPNKPIIYPKSLVESNKNILDLYWDTFTRPPYTKQEEAEATNGLYLDKNVTYDVWITDSLGNLEKFGLPKILDKVPASDLQITNIDDTKNKVFQYKAEEYVTISETGEYIRKPIEQNKVYYIRVVATKPTDDGLGLSSMPSIAQIYIPANGDIATPKALSKPPFKVKKDDKGVDMITQTDITVTWNTKWFEIYDDATQEWYANASLRDGTIIYGKNVKDTDTIINFYDKDSEEDVKKAFSDAGYTDAQNILVRSMDISSKDMKYEMITVPFDEINQSGGYEKYLEQIMQSDSDKWQEIEPKFNDDKHAEYTIKELTANTKYAIILRPYRILLDGKKDAYPTYLLATTLPEDTVVDITPVVPTLFEVSKTDTSIEVEWPRMSNNMLYELAIDENQIEDPSKATKVIDSEEIKNNSILYTKEDESEYQKYTIKDLFPDTGYYIWIRAKVDGTEKISEWSNPIYVKTNAIVKPNAPSGFGLASDKSVSTYNTNNNTNYKPITNNYLILEWMRDPQDLLEEPKADKGDENVEALIDSNLKKTYMAKFNNLIGNKYYYTRAKTKLTLAKGKDGLERSYSYIIQVSPYQDFKDVMEIEIPKTEVKGDRVISAESDWTSVYKYKTGPSVDGDYDENIVDDLYPLPTEDFEVVYDDKNQTLTYRFRSNKKDTGNNSDNLVDQRFISKLINNKVYNYNLDMTTHKNYTIKNRRVELPYTIISTLNDRKISLSLTVGGTRFTLKPNFLNTSEVKSLGQISSDAMVCIDITENPQNLPVLNYNQSYATSPQNIKMSFENNGKVKQMSYLGSDMDVFMKLKNRGLVLENNVGAYRNLGNNVWDRVPSVYDNETGTHTVKTNRLGNYATISNGLKQDNQTNASINTQISVNNKLMFTDASNLNMDSPISTVQFNNIVAGIVANKNQIAINGGLSDTEYNSLKQSGMLLQGSIVGREAGINTLVKLYELKTKTKYQPVDTINTTPYKDIKNANKAYQQNLIKAGELGFYGDATNVNPKDVMTISDMLSMVNIILEDSGY